MNFWKEKNVLVTGHTGFKGSWLCELLLARGCRVYGLALQPHARPSLFMQLDLQKRIDHFVCDVRNFQGVSDRIITVQPDVVIHMAAQSLVRRSYIEPVLTLSTNLMGTVSLLESLRKLECRCAVVIVTTDKVYKDINEDHPKVETDQLGGHDPYSASKAAVELLVDSYRRSFFGVEAKLAGGEQHFDCDREIWKCCRWR